jgi:predicted lysophospholipase L1 biosynthesis ABC-type transport system permease subunit
LHATLATSISTGLGNGGAGAGDILGRVALVVGALALVILIAGAVILGGAIAATRVRESTLLKVLGARRRDLGRILLTEYLALAVTAGGLLGQVATR